jgi:hypothetical protein
MTMSSIRAPRYMALGGHDTSPRLDERPLTHLRYPEAAVRPQEGFS